jgi:hypothetical protein
MSETPVARASITSRASGPNSLVGLDSGLQVNRGVRAPV